MEKFQQLIFQALAKTDDSVSENRQKVYEQIWIMQEKSLLAQKRSEEDKNFKRQQLTQLLKNIEGQYRSGMHAKVQPEKAQPTVKPVDKVEPAMGVPHKKGAVPPAKPQIRQEPELNGFNTNSNTQQNTWRNQQNRTFEPQIDRPQSEMRSAFSKTPKKKQDSADKSLYYLEKEVNKKSKKNAGRPSFFRRIKLTTYLLILLTFIVALFVAWSFYNSFGLSGISEKHQAMSHALMQQNNYSQEGWIEVFDPSNANGLTVKGSAAADLHHEVDTNFIRVTTHKANDAAVIEIGQGALMKLRGKTATFKLIARNVGEDIGQLQLVADTGNGNDAKYQFELSPTTTPLLFRLDIPQQLNGPVKVYLSGDSANNTDHIDIFALLVRQADEKGN